MKTICIDICTKCQLHCPMCVHDPYTNSSMGVLGTGYMKVEDFSKILSLNNWVERVSLSNYGELLLNPDFEKIVRYAKSKNIRVAFQTNFNDVKKEQIEAIVDTADSVSISLAGITNAEHSKVRGGGNLYKVMDNIEKLIEEKKRKGHNTKYSPHIPLKFIENDRNKDHTPIFKEWASKLGLQVTVVRDWVAVAEDSKSASKEEQSKSVKTNGPFCDFADQLLNEPRINWDGQLLGCCVNFWHTYGNALEKSFEELKENPEYQKWIKYVQTGVGLIDVPCKQCACWKGPK